MDFNPFLNKLITERNSAVVEDPLVDLLAEMVKAIVRLEAQQETPASVETKEMTMNYGTQEHPVATLKETFGPTSHESSNANQGEITEPSVRTIDSSERISSVSVHGWLSVDQVIRETPPPPSRTTEPTSSTPSTDRSTGPSVSTPVHNHNWLLKGVTYGWSDTIPYKVTLYCRDCAEWCSVEAPQSSLDSPASSPEPAQGGGEWMPGTGHCFYPHPTIEGMTCSLAPNHEGNHSTSRYWPSRIMKEGSERG